MGAESLARERVRILPIEVTAGTWTDYFSRRKPGYTTPMGAHTSLFPKNYWSEIPYKEVEGREYIGRLRLDDHNWSSSRYTSTAPKNTSCYCSAWPIDPHMTLAKDAAVGADGVVYYMASHSRSYSWRDLEGSHGRRSNSPRREPFVEPGGHPDPPYTKTLLDGR